MPHLMSIWNTYTHRVLQCRKYCNVIRTASCGVHCKYNPWGLWGIFTGYISTFYVVLNMLCAWEFIYSISLMLCWICTCTYTLQQIVLDWTEPRSWTQQLSGVYTCMLWSKWVFMYVRVWLCVYDWLWSQYISSTMAPAIKQCIFFTTVCIQHSRYMPLLYQLNVKSCMMFTATRLIQNDF